MISPSSPQVPSLFYQTPAGKAFWYGLVGFAFFSTCSISGSQICLGISLIAGLFAYRAGTLQPRWSPLEPAFGFLGICALLALINAVDLPRAVIELKKFLILIPFWFPYWLGLDSGRQRTLLGTTLCSGSLVCLIQLALTLSEIPFGFQRAEGLFSLPLSFGENQALCLFMTIAWLHVGESDPQTRKRLWLAGIFQFFGVVSSMARGAWIGLFIGLLYLFRDNGKTFLKVFLIIAIIFLLTAFLTEFHKSQFFLVRPDDTVRFRIWQIGAAIIGVKPVFGVGMNNVKTLYAERVTREEKQKSWIFGHQHNHFLHYLLMTGLLGFIALFWWLTVMGSFCLNMGKAGQDPWQIGIGERAFGLFLCFWCSGFTEYVFGDEEVAMLFFFLLGVLGSPSVGRFPEAITPETDQTATPSTPPFTAPGNV